MSQKHHHILQNGPWWQAEAASTNVETKKLPNFQDYMDYLENSIHTDTTPKKEIDEHTCPKCLSREFAPDQDYASFSCYNCGWVGEQWIDASQEWRVYSTDDHHRPGHDPSRVGSFIHDDFRKSSLSTCIKGVNGIHSVRRIQKYQSMDQKERRLYQSFRILNDASQDVNHQTCEKAKNIFKSVNETKQRPSNRRTSMAACLYLASREEDTQTNRKALDEISNRFLVRAKKIQKVSKTSREVLFQKNADAAKKWAPAEATDEIIRIQKFIGPIHPTCISSAQEIANHSKDNGFGLYTIPTSLAVGCLWWVYQEVNAPYTQEQLANAAECSIATVQRSYQALLTNKMFIDTMRTIQPIFLTQENQSNSYLTGTFHEDVSVGNAK